MKIRPMKKGDRILLVLIPIIIAAAFLFRGFLFSGPSTGKIIVSRSGTEIAEYSLKDSVNHIIESDSGGRNTLHIKDGEAWISDADCPDKICEKAGHISRPGEVIVCMPHKLIITVE